MPFVFSEKALRETRDTIPNIYWKGLVRRLHLDPSNNLQLRVPQRQPLKQTPTTSVNH